MAALPAEAQAVVCKPPNRIKRPSVFLAGSIEMGKARNWQQDLTSILSHLPIMIFNPRRDDWDKSWEQDISNQPFKEQVDWELDHLDDADVIAMFFEAKTQSPISLLELGLYARTGKLVVCCEKGFKRRGNVQVVCDRFALPLVDTMEQLERQIVERLLDTGRVNVHLKGQNGRTPLSWAARNGDATLVKQLLQIDSVDIDCKDDGGKTPLSLAAWFGHDAVVKQLLETGKVDVDSKDENGRTPLSWAVENGHGAVIKQLLEAGKANNNSENNSGRPLLSLIIENEEQF